MIQQGIKLTIMVQLWMLMLTTISFNSKAQPTSYNLTNRIIIIGDAGLTTEGKTPVLEAIRRSEKLDQKTTVLYLGNYVPHTGLPNEAAPNYSKVKNLLNQQINIGKGTAAQVILVPGNSDWANGRKDGFQELMRLENLIKINAPDHVHMAPDDGCPGPEEITLEGNVVLLVFDSQWWLHTGDKPGVESDCNQKTQEAFLNELGELLRKNANKLVLLAAHHTFKSNGIHGGYFGLKQHLFPLTDFNKILHIPFPIIGSIYPISRSLFGAPQDLHHPEYRRMIKMVKEVANTHPNLIFLGAHDNNLQLLGDSTTRFIVSGSGSKSTRVERSNQAQFISDSLGYAVLETYANKDVALRFRVVNKQSGEVQTAYENVVYNFAKVPALETAYTDTTIPIYENKVSMAASKQYSKPLLFQSFALGKNYRKEWSEPVQLPVLNLKKEGLRISKYSVGSQTQILFLKDRNGKEWLLRKIDKDPRIALPEKLRTGLAKDIVQDMTSALYPYAALVIPQLAEANNIVHATPKYYVLPDDPALGYYQPLFANSMVLLEAANPGNSKSASISTPKVFDKLLNETSTKIDQEQVLKARLLDMLIADWDRNAGQWQWENKVTDSERVYYAIPYDRDMALFHSDGKLIWYLSRKIIPFLKGFNTKIQDINHFNTNVQDFDRTFLNALNQEQWSRITQEFINNITDEVIVNAVKDLPPEIYQLDGISITEKLKSRRNDLYKKSMQYYHFISNIVNITGSNEKDVFKVDMDTMGQLQVKVHSYIPERHAVGLRYQRSFDIKNTKEIRLYGFNEKDLFQIDLPKRIKTKMRIIGGKDVDTFSVNTKGKTFVYDYSPEGNVVAQWQGLRLRESDHPEVNLYQSKIFKYNIRRFPRLNVGFNGDDGLMIGLGMWDQTHSFRKDPYQTDQKIGTLIAPSRGAFQIKYRGHFVHVAGKHDLLVLAEWINPTLNNFFGYGNESVYDKKLTRQFYRVRYTILSADVFIKRRWNRFVTLSAGPSFFYYWNNVKRNMGYILEEPQTFLNLDSITVYTPKMYAGAKVNLTIDNVNNEFLPTRGINWITEFTALQPLSTFSHPLTKLESHLNLYVTMNDNPRLVTVLRVGGGKIFSAYYEYFQALNLGFNNYLRGYRKNRFSGDAMAYANIEFRYKLFDSRFYLMPGSFGLIAYDDIGRVWYSGEHSKIWHNTVGGGVYYSPYQLAIISATMGISAEDRIFNFSLGAKFNLNF